MRKKINLLLAFVFVVCALCGCASRSTKIRITIGMWPEDSASPYEKAMFDERKAQFEKDYPEYEIVSEPYAYSPNTVVAKAISGQLPVVFRSHCSETAWLAQSGYIYDLTMELHRLNWLNKMNPDLRGMMTHGNGVYGLPREGSGMGLFLNLDMLHQAGIIGKNTDGTYALYDQGTPLYPRSVNDIQKASESLRSFYGNETYGMIIMTNDTSGGRQFTNLAWNFGAANFQLLQEDGRWISGINSAASVKAMNWIQDMRKSDMLAYPSAYINDSEWYKHIGENKVAMAFCFSDAVSLPVVNHGFPLENMAFVPMPTGNGSNRFSIADGVAYMFSAKATQQQVKGALLFLKYIGSSPETDSVALDGLRSYYQALNDAGLPVTPSIKGWNDSAYLKVAQELESTYMNVNPLYFQDFFDAYDAMKREEDPNYRKVMYAMLDSVIQRVVSDPFGVNAERFLTETSNSFETMYLSNL